MTAPLALPLGEHAVLDAIRRKALPLTGDQRDYDALMALIGAARIVMLGEASHGTHEFYRERARITKRPDHRARLHGRRDRRRLARRAARQPLCPRSARGCRRRAGAARLPALHAHLDRHGGTAGIVVWAHNSHVGDARATEMSRRGELNIGQLMRERHGRDVVNVGFTTYSGTVTAASDWDAPAERKQVRRALPDRYEALLHATHIPSFLLCPLAAGDSGRALNEPRLERAIGVIYRPQTERQSHYFSASAARRFDALVHIDHTRAVEPLETTQTWARGEPPETYPTAL